jgi:hypothetical protein
MGETSRFRGGDKAPNNGEYMEVGESSMHMGVENPKHVYLHKGEHFPKNSNADRKWVKMKHGVTH